MKGSLVREERCFETVTVERHIELGPRAGRHRAVPHGRADGLAIIEVPLWVPSQFGGQDRPTVRMEMHRDAAHSKEARKSSHREAFASNVPRWVQPRDPVVAHPSVRPARNQERSEILPESCDGRPLLASRRPYSEPQRSDAGGTPSGRRKRVGGNIHDTTLLAVAGLADRCKHRRPGIARWVGCEDRAAPLDLAAERLERDREPTKCGGIHRCGATSAWSMCAFSAIIVAVNRDRIRSGARCILPEHCGVIRAPRTAARYESPGSVGDVGSTKSRKVNRQRPGPWKAAQLQRVRTLGIDHCSRGRAHDIVGLVGGRHVPTRNANCP